MMKSTMYREDPSSCRMAKCSAVSSFTCQTSNMTGCHPAPKRKLRPGVACMCNYQAYLYLNLYVRGRRPKPPSAEAMYIQPNVQPQYDQRSAKPPSGSCEPKKSGWSHFALFLRLHGMWSHNGVSRYHISTAVPWKVVRGLSSLLVFILLLVSKWVRKCVRCYSYS